MIKLFTTVVITTLFVTHILSPARVTAYAPLDNRSGICADSNPTVTSTGLAPSSKVVAVDPTKIPYGTCLYIPGYGIVVAGDTGGILRAYDGIAIDVFFDTYDEAMAWGVQHTIIFRLPQDWCR